MPKGKRLSRQLVVKRFDDFVVLVNDVATIVFTRSECAVIVIFDKIVGQWNDGLALLVDDTCFFVFDHNCQAIIKAFGGIVL